MMRTQLHAAIAIAIIIAITMHRISIAIIVGQC
jgi:hypothetical protein